MAIRIIQDIEVASRMEKSGSSYAAAKYVEDMFDFLVHKGFINLKEFEEFKKNREIIKNIS